MGARLAGPCSGVPLSRLRGLMQQPFSGTRSGLNDCIEGFSVKLISPTTLADAPWYLVQSRPNQSHIASRNLRRQGIEFFLPMQRAALRRRGRIAEAVRPLFNGYFFVTFDPARPEWRAINTTPGVLRLVRFGAGYPKQVPSALVIGLMLRCDEAGVLRPPQDLGPGDAVRIVSGPFVDFVATVESVLPARRVTLLLDLMGRPTRVAVPAEVLARR